ncbi:MAG: hypothetical protein WBL20_04385 [Sphingobium sp.]|uniref:hypothetical protein n=1 Tax=Sphingobium sp. TaxID=1912891 RepID=UPI003BB02796
MRLVLWIALASISGALMGCSGQPPAVDNAAKENAIESALVKPAPEQAARYRRLEQAYQHLRAQVRADPVKYVDAPRELRLIEQELRDVSPLGFDRLRRQEDALDAQANADRNANEADEIANRLSR